MNDTEKFWAGDFGHQYHARQTVSHAANVALFGRILAATAGVHSIAELGAGTGLNLQALRHLQEDFDLCGVEINIEAVREILRIPGVVGVQCSALDWRPTRRFDLTFTKGMLIHIPPDDLPDAYETLVNVSSRYVAVCEYYNPTPVEVPYRGHAGRLWKRDFAGEMMKQHNLRLVDYGFVYRNAPIFPQDDITWFLMEKKP